MNHTVFFRLLKTSIEDKGEALAGQIAALNDAGQTQETYVLDPTDFSHISGSPFVYWAKYLINSATSFPVLEPKFGRVIRGPEVHDLKQSVRVWTEVPPELIGPGMKWVDYAKGGKLKPYAPDVHLVVDFGSACSGSVPFRRPGDDADYFEAGLTYTQRTTSRLTLRVMNSGCLTSPKGPGIIPSMPHWLWYLMAIGNSILFQQFVELKVGAADAAARSYDLNILRDAPVPIPEKDMILKVESYVRNILNLAQLSDAADETSHAFSLPSLLHNRLGSLLGTSILYEEAMQTAQNHAITLQSAIDDLVFELYGLGEADRDVARGEIGVRNGSIDDIAEASNIGDHDASVAEELDEDEESTPPEDLPARVQNLLMWCVGVAFGRWDVRFALDPALLPALQGPFDPLPRCAPGALVGTNGLPPANAAGIAPASWFRTRKDVLDLPAFPQQGEKSEPKVDYPLHVAWNGILVDDPTHPADIVTRVGDVLRLMWGEQAGVIEREACEILGYKTLRDYFRDARQGFFAFHVKRYSKSRRKAPIYWLLQSERRSYAIWLYCHRLDSTSLYTAGRDFADVKLALEQGRLDELRQGLESLAGSTRKQREREADRQAKLVAEVADFRRRLDAVALLNLPPDLNDGVVISVAPLWELMPWREAQRTWEKLRAGEYAWSTMAGQMRERGLVK